MLVLTDQNIKAIRHSNGPLLVHCQSIYIVGMAVAPLTKRKKSTMHKNLEINTYLAICGTKSQCTAAALVAFKWIQIVYCQE